jgi:hypothetical protein
MSKQTIDKFKKLNTIKEQNIPEKINQLIKPFLICPTCQNIDNEANFILLEHQLFQCTCNNCQTTWGLKRCGDCQKNYPFISIQGIENYLHNEKRLNLDKVFGREILAIPEQKENNITFSCSFCAN